MLEQTGCDGISVGRMAVAQPWLFAQWMLGYEPDQNTYADTALKLTGLLSHYYNPVFAVKLFKKFVPYYSANFKFGHQIRKKLVEKDTMEAIEENIRTILTPCPELSSRPNLNLFS
jgi:tRNA-dihydrouridine synthase